MDMQTWIMVPVALSALASGYGIGRRSRSSIAAQLAGETQRANQAVEARNEACEVARKAEAACVQLEADVTQARTALSEAMSSAAARIKALDEALADRTRERDTLKATLAVAPQLSPSAVKSRHRKRAA